MCVCARAGTNERKILNFQRHRNCPIYNPNSETLWVFAPVFFMWSVGAPRRAQRSHQSTFRARKGALTSVVSKVRNFSNKKFGEIWRKMPNLQNRIAHQRAGRLFCFWARPMHQGGRNGATKPPFRARKGALTSVVSKARNFSNKKIGEIWRKMPNLQNRITHQRAERLFFSGLGQCTKAGATEPPSHLFVRERARLLVLFPRPVTFRTKELGKFGEKCPIYKTELRINVPGDYFVSGLGQCTKAGATEPPIHFSCEKGRAY